VRTALIFFIILICYGLLTIATAFAMPLRLGEIIQAAAFLNFSWESFFLWIGQTPGGAPFQYLTQLPLALINLNSAILLRIPSILFALASSLAFFALAKRIPLRFPLFALLLFLLVPTHLAYATQGRPYELGLFLLLLAALAFFNLVEQPGIFKALVYAVVLTGCLYTQPSCFLPALGYLLGLLGFANLKTYRRALWFSLGATVLPMAAYAPYYGWAAVHRSGDWWLAEQFPAYAVKVTGLEALMSLDPGGWNPWLGIGLMGLLLFGLIGGISSAMPLGSYPEGTPVPRADLLRTRSVVFCLAMGAVVAFLGETAFSGFYNQPFVPYQVLWALPGLIIVFGAGLDAFIRLRVMKSLWFFAPICFILAIGLCVPGDIEYLTTQPTDMAKLTALVRPQIQGDACVVFVSERLSRYLFEVFDPTLGKYECQNFFHKRVVLAIHPFVRADQEREALTFFRGLDFAETNHQSSGKGQVITMDVVR